MINDEVDTDPDNPDGIFLPSDRRQFDSRKPQDVLAHDCAAANFDARMAQRERDKTYHMKWNHVDGPCMVTAGGMSYWLTYRERILAFFGLLDLDKLHKEILTCRTARLLRRWW